MSFMKTIKPFFVEKPWAGDFIAGFYHQDKKKIGEAWLLSTMKGQESEIEGQTLSSYLKKELPFLIKIIDASEPLSIQVHPNDEFAHKLENSRGKTECWLIVDHAPGAGIYLGTKKEVSAETFKSKVLKGESVEELMNFFPVKKGDFIQVPAGTIHAIGGGVTILEVQQASGITYRLWDWGREGRELHLDKGMMVSDFDPKFVYQKEITKKGPADLMKHSDFECYFNKSIGEGWFLDLKTLTMSFGEKSSGGDYIFVR